MNKNKVTQTFKHFFFNKTSKHYQTILYAKKIHLQKLSNQQALKRIDKYQWPLWNSQEELVSQNIRRMTQFCQISTI